MATQLADLRTVDRDSVLANAPHRIGRVALVVRDLDRVAEFYRTVLGLHVQERTAGLARLGTRDSVLLELRRDPQARVRGRREAGLFHTAFLLPGRAHLGAWLVNASAQGIRLAGASDHRVSEALYLNDPEGNGIEIYVDRPSAAWRWTGAAVDMATEPLDLDALAKAAMGRRWSGFPDEGLVGHIHLQVGDLAQADGFYQDRLGLELTARYPGASFYGSGGYHHQIAANVWNSRGAHVRTDRATGLAEIELVVADEVLEAVRAREAVQGDVAPTDRIALRDPWGTPIVLNASGKEQ